jgi:uncharacterized membrane protein
MNQFLLFWHLIGGIITIGAALYDRFYIVRNIRLARGSNLERDLIQIYLSTGPLYSVGAVLILFSGIGLTLAHRAGFFNLSVVGLKQFIFLGIGLTFPFYIIPLMLKIDRLLSTAPVTEVPEQCRALLERLYFILDVITIASILILAISVWKPDLHALILLVL